MVRRERRASHSNIQAWQANPSAGGADHGTRDGEVQARRAAGATRLYVFGNTPAEPAAARCESGNSRIRSNPRPAECRWQTRSVQGPGGAQRIGNGPIVLCMPSGRVRQVSRRGAGTKYLIALHVPSLHVAREPPTGGLTFLHISAALLDLRLPCLRSISIPRAASMINWVSVENLRSPRRPFIDTTRRSIHHYAGHPRPVLAKGDVLHETPHTMLGRATAAVAFALLLGACSAAAAHRCPAACRSSGRCVSPRPVSDRRAPLAEDAAVIRIHGENITVDFCGAALDGEPGR